MCVIYKNVIKEGDYDDCCKVIWDKECKCVCVKVDFFYLTSIQMNEKVKKKKEKKKKKKEIKRRIEEKSKKSVYESSLYRETLKKKIMPSFIQPT